jgi:hypothetical protein
MTAADARRFRSALETHEAKTGKPLQGNWRHKMHLLFTWADELVHHPKVLDAVEDVIGPDILCWTTNFFIKEANSPGVRLVAPGFNLLGTRSGRRRDCLGRLHRTSPRRTATCR